MKLKNILPNYINKTVEVFLENGFYEGLLLSVSDFSIEIQTTPGYYGPTSSLNILLSKVKHLRVVNP